MNPTRRTFSLSLVALATTPAANALMMNCGGEMDPIEPTWGRGADNGIAEAILARRLARLDQGYVRGQSPDAIRTQFRANFPQLIEQNFAVMSPRRLAGSVAGLSEQEMAALAQAYSRANADLNRQGLLLPLLALRATPTQLQRIAAHFGESEVLHALQVYSPGKLMQFQATPLYRPQTLGKGGGGPAPFLDMSIGDIYLSFRTAPYGASLGVSSSLLMTATVAGGSLLGAWSFGYETVGPTVSSLIQTYAPALHNAIGSGINWFVEGLRDSLTNPAALGNMEKEGADMFELLPIAYNTLGSTGGDFGALEDWRDYAGGASLSC